MTRRIVTGLMSILVCTVAPSMVTADITTGLVAHWKMGETAGPTSADSVGGHHGTLNNFPGDDSQWVCRQSKEKRGF